MFGGKTDEVVVGELIKTLDMKLDGYEKILSKQKYLAGDVRTFLRTDNPAAHTSTSQYAPEPLSLPFHPSSSPFPSPISSKHFTSPIQIESI